MRLIGEGGLVNVGPKTVIIPPLTLAALDEVTSIRLVLEGLAAGLATERITKEAVAEAIKQLDLPALTAYYQIKIGVRPETLAAM